jgi:hypothetical protein
MTNPGGFSAPVVSIIEDVKLKRWAMVYRIKNITATPDANTRLFYGIVTTVGKIGCGSIGPISTSFLTSISAGLGATFTAGTDLSTKASDANNFIWLYVYNDLTTVKFNIDGEAADKTVCATSTLTSVPATALAINFPAGGVRVEGFDIDKAYCFTEL